MIAKKIRRKTGIRNNTKYKLRFWSNDTSISKPEFFRHFGRPFPFLQPLTVGSHLWWCLRHRTVEVRSSRRCSHTHGGLSSEAPVPVQWKKYRLFRVYRGLISIPSRKLSTYPTEREVGNIIDSNMPPYQGDMLIPWRVIPIIMKQYIRIPIKHY